MTDQRFDEMKANLAVIDKRLDRLQAAAKLTLLFHSGDSYWNSRQQGQWMALLSLAHGLKTWPKDVDVTTKVLCDAVRAALNE